MSFEQDFVDLAKEMLEEFGFNIILRKVSLGDFDVENGEREKTTVDYQGLGLFQNIKEGEFVESSYVIQSEDKKMIVQSDNDFNIGDLIVIDSEEYEIKVKEEVMAKKTTVIYKLIVG